LKSGSLISEPAKIKTIMKKAVLALVLFAFMTPFAGAQVRTPSDADPSVPDGFESDGCSLFPDGDYRDCCVQHDLSYFSGGSWKARWRADDQLRKCVAGKRGFQHKPLSFLMWFGVRIGGVPWLPTPFRWGFGRKPEVRPASNSGWPSATDPMRPASDE
jgi:hypothetical protein